jgi:Flp pilus assembly protein TadD
MRRLALVLVVAAASGCGPPDNAAKPGAKRPAYDPDRDSRPLPSEEHLRRAESLIQEERFAEAAAEFRKVLQQDEKNVAALSGLNRIASRTGDAAGALAFIARAVELRPDDGTLVNQMGVALVMNGKRCEAAKAFERANALRPEDPLVLLNAANNWADLGEWARAQECARSAADRLPEVETPWLVLGRLQVRQGKSAEAIPFFREAARRAPENSLVHYHLGKALVAAGRREEAEGPFRIALRGNPPAEIKQEVEALLAGAHPK